MDGSTIGADSTVEASDAEALAARSVGSPKDAGASETRPEASNLPDESNENRPIARREMETEPMPTSPSPLLTAISKHVSSLGYKATFDEDTDALLCTNNSGFHIVFRESDDGDGIDYLHSAVYLGRNHRVVNESHLRKVNDLNVVFGGWFTVYYDDTGDLIIVKKLPHYQYDRDSFIGIMDKWAFVESVLINSIEEL